MGRTKLPTYKRKAYVAAARFTSREYSRVDVRAQQLKMTMAEFVEHATLQLVERMETAQKMLEEETVHE